jgi:exonuclease VII small subunit
MNKENNKEPNKSKSINEYRKQVVELLDRLEKSDLSLDEFKNDYKKLIELNNKINDYFKSKSQKLREKN